MCRLFTVTGRVQGVFFRASTRNTALSFGLTGHAINLPDGSVEVRACGDEDALNQLREWLDHGPRHATVTRVVEAPVTCTSPGRFTTG